MTNDALSVDPASAAICTLRVVEGAGIAEEADAIDFLKASALPLSGVILGLFDQSDDCIKIIAVDGSLQFMNCNGKKAMQIDDFSMVAGQQWADLWPEESRELVDSAIRQALGGQMARFESFCPTAKGTPRWWEVTISPLRDAAGEVLALLSTSRDVSERVRREEAATIVALEMRHRLRNAHSVSAALLIASGQADREHLEFARAAAARLARLAEVHAKLVDVGGGMDLSTLCLDVAEVFAQSGGRLEYYDLPNPHLDEERARAISLILGELTTNSLKHGALGRGGSARLGGSVENGELRLDWREEFEEPSAPSRQISSGQGSALMTRIVGLYRGSIVARPYPAGYRAEIRLPL